MAIIGSMYGKFPSRAGTVPRPPDPSPGGRVKFEDRQVSEQRRAGGGRNYQAGDVDIPDYATQEAPWYKVKPGDTMWDIANDFNTTLDSLLSENPQIDNPNLILPNQLISLPLDARHKGEEEEPDLSPGGRIKWEDREVGGEGGESGFGDTVTVQSGDTLWDIAQQHGTTWQELQTLNKISDPNLIYPGQQIFLPGQPWENYPSG
jgi:LysM repeat protein